MNISSFIVNGVNNSVKPYNNRKENRDKNHLKSSSNKKKRKPNEDNEDKNSESEKTTGNIFDDYI